MDLDDRAGSATPLPASINAADRSGHPLLPAYMLASMGQFAVSCGDAIDGLRLVGAARQRLSRSAPPIASVWMDSVEALAMAEALDRQSLIRLQQARIGRAATDEPVWPWIFRFNHRTLATFRAQASVALGETRIAQSALHAPRDGTHAPKSLAHLDVMQRRSCRFSAIGDWSPGSFSHPEFGIDVSLSAVLVVGRAVPADRGRRVSYAFGSATGSKSRGGRRLRFTATTDSVALPGETHVIR
jgi:hypothetical protein